MNINDVKKIKNDPTQFIVALIKKIFQRCPLGSVVIQNADVFYPNSMLNHLQLLRLNYWNCYIIWYHSGPILESKGMREIFQKRAKYIKIWAKMFKIWKYFEIGQPHSCEYCIHETARICPLTKQLPQPPLRKH